MYRLLRPFLFSLPPERAHHLTFSLLELAARIPALLPLASGAKPPAGAAVEAMGLRFPSPVGLAAGMDKDARHVDALAAIGFGFIEVGTLTPRPQPGNPQPRLFRLKKDRALINRMGFNNGGVQAAVERLRSRKPGIVVGGNIGKNKDTPNERALDDYLACFDALHDVVDYFVVNVSSPNTPGLRALQEKGPLLGILSALKERSMLRSTSGTQQVRPPKPILLKIAPDLSEGELDDIVAVVKESGIAGVIATNTTIAREGLHARKAELEAIGAGGLSGAPLRVRSTEVVRYLRQRLQRPVAIIGVGGIDSWEAAKEKLDAGADLVQVYTGLVYQGPALVRRINAGYARRGRSTTD
jgi:dihydroorotate dehydrogenase